MAQWHKVVTELIELIKEHKWEDDFNQAITNARKWNIPELADIKNLQDYLAWINDLLYWIPSEDVPGKEIYNHLCKFYFIIDQPPVLGLQNRVVPHPKVPPATPFSAWMVKYAKAMGEFLDTPESLTPQSLQSFYNSPNYNMNDYLRPHGDWKTFNQLFARNFKPGYRPVAAVADDHVIVSPADSTFAGQWEIRVDSHVTVKNLHWMISELMEGSSYKGKNILDKSTRLGVFLDSWTTKSKSRRRCKRRSFCLAILMYASSIWQRNAGQTASSPALLAVAPM